MRIEREKVTDPLQLLGGSKRAYPPKRPYDNLLRVTLYLNANTCLGFEHIDPEQYKEVMEYIREVNSQGTAALRELLFTLVYEHLFESPVQAPPNDVHPYFRNPENLMLALYDQMESFFFDKIGPEIAEMLDEKLANASLTTLTPATPVPDVPLVDYHPDEQDFFSSSF